MISFVDAVLSILAVCCVAAVLSTEQNYCESYLNCAQKLEQKQRECLELQERKSAGKKSNCSNLSRTYRGLELRKTEQYRDCVRKNLHQSETFVDLLAGRTCDKLAKKFASTTNKLTKRQQKRLSKKKKDLKKRELKECRSSAKVWHKHCRRIAKCCPAYTGCGAEIAPLQKQIMEEKRRFHESKLKCYNKRHNFNEAK